VGEVGVPVGDCVALGGGHPGVEVGVPVGVALGVPVGVGLGVPVGVALGVPVGVGLGVPVGVALGVPVGLALGVPVGVGLGVPVGVGLGVPRITGTQRENSDVLPVESVAVAVITWPGWTFSPKVTLNGAVQLLSVITSVEPIKVSPEPLPEGWH